MKKVFFINNIGGRRVVGVAFVGEDGKISKVVKM